MKKITPAFKNNFFKKLFNLNVNAIANHYHLRYISHVFILKLY